MPARFEGGTSSTAVAAAKKKSIANIAKAGAGSAAAGTVKQKTVSSGGGTVGGGAALGAALGATGGGGGGGFGGFAAPAVDPNAWKTDSTYLAQLAALDKALKDYQAQKDDSMNRYNVDFTNRTRDLGIDKGLAQDSNYNDYASRGMYHSGLMVDATGKLLDMFSRRQGDMETAKANYLAGLNTDFTNFQSEQDLTRQKAQQDAIARAAAGIVI